MTTPTARRTFLALSSAALLAAAGGCSLLGGEERSSSAPRGRTTPVAVPTDFSRMVVVYFSMPETDKTTGLSTEEENSVVVVNGVALGNTQYVAQLIAQGTGVETARIETVEAYPLDHQQLIDKARSEQDEGARPAIQPLADMSAYDTIFLGYPIWWSDIPMPLYTFLESTDLTGKTIIPFSTHGGSGLAGTPESIAGAAPGAAVSDNALSISRDDMDGARPRSPPGWRNWVCERRRPRGGPAGPQSPAVAPGPVARGGPGAAPSAGRLRAPGGGPHDYAPAGRAGHRRLHLVAAGDPAVAAVAMAGAPGRPGLHLRPPWDAGTGRPGPGLVPPGLHLRRRPAGRATGRVGLAPLRGDRLAGGVLPVGLDRRPRPGHRAGARPAGAPGAPPRRRLAAPAQPRRRGHGLGPRPHPDPAARRVRGFPPPVRRRHRGRPRRLGRVGLGVGVAPLLSMLDAYSGRRPVHLLWSLRPADMGAAAGLVERYRGAARLTLHAHRFTAVDLASALDDAERARGQYFIAGPPRAVIATRRALRGLGVPRARLHDERFTM